MVCKASRKCINEVIKSGVSPMTVAEVAIDHMRDSKGNLPKDRTFFIMKMLVR
jgi:hypothetical protein